MVVVSLKGELLRGIKTVETRREEGRERRVSSSSSSTESVVA
jgi:hypothetical protein